MEEIVYSNIQAKPSCSGGNCNYSCGLSGFELSFDGCSPLGCSCDTTSSDWTSGCNGGDCVNGYESGCTTGCI
jgi:hypothetical protein